MRMVPPPPAPPAADPTPPPASAVPVVAGSWPGTLLTAEEILTRADSLPFAHVADRVGIRGTRRLLTALAATPGVTWQQRWVGAGCDDAGDGWVNALGDPWAGLSPHTRRNEATGGINVLLCLDVIRPSYAWLHAVRLNKTYDVVRRLRDPEFVRHAEHYNQDANHPVALFIKAMLCIAKIMLATGKTAGELTPEDLIDYRHATFRLRGKVDGAEYAWDLLSLFGGFPEGTLPMREALREGRPSVPEMVDFYGIACQPVRELLVRYLSERAPALDYASLRALAWKLCGAFWQDLETHHPGIDSLHLPEPIASAWKQRLRGGSNRTDPWPILFAVRAFYLDIAQWATQDAYWAAWAAPCPISVNDTRGAMKHKKRVQARLHQKIRALTPHLPALLRSLDAQLERDTALLAAATATPAGQRFIFRGADYERPHLTAMRDSSYRGTGRVWVRDVATGQRIDQTREEDRTFWAWAAVNTFHYTGVRLEELVEITQTALFTYRLPDTGQAIPLLQIVPSKNDAERVLLVPPELAHVLARVKQRVRDGGATVPPVVRYDPYERTTTAPLPYLFQRKHGTQRRVIAPGHLQAMINQVIAKAGFVGPDGTGLHLTPHDFRRIFATDAVSGGLPVHIVAKLLGHQSLTTTEAYTAIYPEDVLRHYRAFITRRRAQRPSEEYRDPTQAEWEEFQQHFAKRKVELGTCGRGYGTPCIHEHACIRCPMLRPDPAQRPRLEEIVTSLGERISEARARGWLGEVEGLEISLAAAHHTLQQMDSSVAFLGLPTGPARPSEATP